MDNSQINVYSSKEYKRSRNAYTGEGAFRYFVSLFVGDAFLAKLLTEIGFNEAETGIISSFITLAFLFQLVSVFVVRKISNTKLVCTIVHAVSQLLFMTLYLIPFMPFSTSAKKPLVVICILAAYFGNYMVSVVIIRWGNSFVDPLKRASFTSGKEIVALISGIVVSLALGYVLDYFESKNNIIGGFVFAAAGILIFCICNFIMLMLMKEEKKPKVSKKEKISMRDVFVNTLGNRNFLSIVILSIFWNVSNYILVGFLGTYRNLLFENMVLVQIITVSGQLVRAMFSKPFAKYTEKRTFARGMELGFVIIAIATLINVFATPSTAVCLIVYTVLYNIGLAGVSGSISNVTYSYVDSRYFSEASALKNSIAGLFGFFATLVGGKIMNAVEASGNMVLGMHLYGQQVLSVISFVLFVITFLFAHFVVGKQKVMIQ